MEVEKVLRLKELEQKRLANQVAKLVMTDFWGKVEQLAEVLQEQREEKEMKKQNELELDQMVNQTEKFAKTVAENFVIERCRRHSESSTSTRREVESSEGLKFFNKSSRTRHFSSGYRAL